MGKVKEGEAFIEEGDGYRRPEAETTPLDDTAGYMLLELWSWSTQDLFSELIVN